MDCVDALETLSALSRFSSESLTVCCYGDPEVWISGAISQGVSPAVVAAEWFSYVDGLLAVYRSNPDKTMMFSVTEHADAMRQMMFLIGKIAGNSLGATKIEVNSEVDRQPTVSWLIARQFTHYQDGTHASCPI